MGRPKNSKNGVFNYQVNDIVNGILLLEPTWFIRYQSNKIIKVKAWNCKILETDKLITYREDYITDIKKNNRKTHTAINKCEVGYNRVLRGYKRSAIDRGLKWNLNRQDAFNFMKSNCYYCNVIPQQKIFSDKNELLCLYNGIDRKNNDLDYTLENCVSCCGPCNYAKNDRTFHEFKNWIGLLINNYENIN